MERWVVKLIVLLIIFVVVFVFNLLPIKVSETFTRRGESGLRIISYFMCFGGGVFLGVYTLHMAPAVRVLIDNALVKPYDIVYPLADLLIVLGFLVMIFSEHFVISCYNRHRPNKDEGSSSDDDDHIGHKLSSYEKVANGKVDPSRTLALLDDQSSPEKSLEAQSQKLLTSDQGQTNTVLSRHVSAQEPEHDHSDTHLQATRSLVLLLALSLHHVFEGMSVGLKQSISSVWNLCVAIIAHEVVIAFSLGMQMVKTYRSTGKIVVAALMCSVMIPLGMVVGMTLTETGIEETGALQIANGVLQGLATGVFIYVTFFEILQEELAHDKVSFAKLMFVLFGFAVLAALALFPEGDYRIHDSLSPVTNMTENCTCLPLE